MKIGLKEISCFLDQLTLEMIKIELLQKSDGSWTYFASDVAYHKNKLDRKFDFLINILGADHAGYIKRISSSVDALSNSKEN